MDWDVGRYVKAKLYGFHYSVNLFDLIYKKMLIKAVTFDCENNGAFITDDDRSKFYSLLDKPIGCDTTSTDSNSGGCGCSGGSCSI